MSFIENLDKRNLSQQPYGVIVIRDDLFWGYQQAVCIRPCCYANPKGIDGYLCPLPEPTPDIIIPEWSDEDLDDIIF